MAFMFVDGTQIADILLVCPGSLTPEKGHWDSPALPPYAKHGWLSVCLCVCVCVCVWSIVCEGGEEVGGSGAAGLCIDVRCPPRAGLCGIVCQ